MFMIIIVAKISRRELVQHDQITKDIAKKSRFTVFVQIDQFSFGKSHSLPPIVKHTSH